MRRELTITPDSKEISIGGQIPPSTDCSASRRSKPSSEALQSTDGEEVEVNPAPLKFRINAVK